MAGPIKTISIARKKPDGSLGYSHKVGAIWRNDKGVETITFEIPCVVGTPDTVIFVNDPDDRKTQQAGGQV